MSSTLFQGELKAMFNCLKDIIKIVSKVNYTNRNANSPTSTTQVTKEMSVKSNPVVFFDQNNLENCTICDIFRVVFIGPKSDHCIPLSVTDSLTDSCCWDLSDGTLAIEDSISKLLHVVCVANIEAQERVDDSLVEILKLKSWRHYQCHGWCSDLILCESHCCR